MLLPALQILFALDGVVSAAAVEATRAPAGQRAAGRRDLLVLHSNGRLGLYIGAWLACNVSLQQLQQREAATHSGLLGTSAQVPGQGELLPLSLRTRDPLERSCCPPELIVFGTLGPVWKEPWPIGSSQSASAASVAGEGSTVCYQSCQAVHLTCIMHAGWRPHSMSEHLSSRVHVSAGAHRPGQMPAQRADSAHSGSDASMDCGSEVDGDQGSPPVSAEQVSSNGGPDVQALGAALEQAPEARRLRVRFIVGAHVSLAPARMATARAASWAPAALHAQPALSHASMWDASAWNASARGLPCAQQHCCSSSPVSSSGCLHMRAHPRAIARL